MIDGKLEVLLLVCEDRTEELEVDEELLLKIELPLSEETLDVLPLELLTLELLTLELLTLELLILERELELLTSDEELKSELEVSHAVHPVNIPVMDVGVK